MRAWVLGPTGAWGHALAAELLSRGYDVVALGRRDAPDLAERASAAGRKWAFAPFDLALPDLGALPEGAPDALICAAGAVDADRDGLVRANYLGVAALVEEAVRRMRVNGHGRVGVLLGQNGRLGLRGLGDYSAAHGALWTWLEALQADLRAEGVRDVTVTRVLPPRTASPTQENLARRSGHRARTRAPRPGPLLDAILAGRPRAGRRPWLAALATAFR